MGFSLVTARIAGIFVGIGLVLIVAAFLVDAWSVDDTRMVAEIRPAQCQRVTLVDQRDGWHVTGAEDIVIDRASGRVFVSAYDRRSTEALVRKKKTERLPQGGIYPVSLADLQAAAKRPDRTLPVVSLVRPQDVTGGLHPHGLDYDPESDEIVYINRQHVRRNTAWQRHAVIERVGASGAIVMGRNTPVPASANDVAVSPESLILSFDHGAEGIGASLEDAFALRKSGILDLATGTTLFNKARFANGVDAIAHGKIAFAATRDQSVFVLQPQLTDHDAAKVVQRIRLPGGPDNLSDGLDGTLLAALHPSLLRMGAHRKLALGRAPSRIVRIDPATGDLALVFEDQHGTLFQAATVAVEDEKTLVLGSVTDQGVLVCDKHANADMRRS